MPRLSALLSACALGAALFDLSGAAQAQTRDVAGSRDYPGIGRFGGSIITGYLVKDFDAARLQAAPFKDGKATDERRVLGVYLEDAQGRLRALDVPIESARGSFEATITGAQVPMGSVRLWLFVAATQRQLDAVEGQTQADVATAGAPWFPLVLERHAE